MNKCLLNKENLALAIEFSPWEYSFLFKMLSKLENVNQFQHLRESLVLCDHLVLCGAVSVA